MRSKFRLEMDVVVDTDFAADLIEAARRSYAGEGHASCVRKDGAAGPIPAEQPIEGIEDALVELLERNPLLANTNVEFEAVGCTSVSEPRTGRSAVEDGEPPVKVTERPDEPLDNGDTEDDLDEFETGLYLCRWPNGDFSIVKADDREAANQICTAVEHERKRLWHVQKERTPAKTAIGRELQKRLGTKSDPVGSSQCMLRSTTMITNLGDSVPGCERMQ
jgi:hypothetical protein